MFEKILIANRGEIALRIQRTARRMGVRTVSVYSDADRSSPHALGADEAFYLGGSPASESYLDIEKILNAAKQTGAEAIHPGYGFLSENAGFAEACETAGIKFIGPAADVIKVMGSKRDAKALMAENGVPVVPGYFGESDEAVLASKAAEIGFPVLIKASAGGGGRGMRLVTRAEDFSAALVSARREALGAFADDTVLLEKYIERPRHIEVQIFGDEHDNVVHLFERDCSVQRRYQKLIEEAPAPGLTDSQRNLILDAAVKAGKAAGYVGAGTVEFVLDRSGDVYFIEMNTRLQVEHPVTEMITGRDLVEWQLQVATGWSLPAQSQIEMQGHAMELRLCAEDAQRDFAPSTGRITHLNLPEDTARVDHGMAAGYEISPYYDSMVAKLIVHGESRESCRRAAIDAVSRSEVAGVTTNAAFLSNILRHAEFSNVELDTHFIERNSDNLIDADPQPNSISMVVAAVYIAAGRQNGPLLDVSDPWSCNDGFRVNVAHREEMLFSHRQGEQIVAVRYGDPLLVTLDDAEYPCRVQALDGSALQVEVGAAGIGATVVHEGNNLDVFVGGEHVALTYHDPLHSSDEDSAGAGGLGAPMPGTVLEVFVAVDQHVTAGTPLLLMEAMKIEHTITAPFDGIVTELRFAAGEQVAEEGAALVLMTPD